MDRIQRKMLEDKLKQGSINESNDKFEKLSKDERDKKIFYGINQVILKQNELALKIQTNKQLIIICCFLVITILVLMFYNQIQVSNVLNQSEYIMNKAIEGIEKIKY
jgi:hypothetical protein